MVDLWSYVVGMGMGAGVAGVLVWIIGAISRRRKK